MTPELDALARRAVACPRWRWMPGMLAALSEGMVTSPLRLTDERRLHYPDEYDWPHDLGLRLPDLTDPATVGCLLALVREAWRCPTAYVRQSTSRRVSDGAFAWEVCDLWLDAEACRALGVDRQGSVASWGHGSEAEALVAALENGGGGA